MTDAPRTPDTEELITQLEATIARAGVQAEAETLQEADRLLEELRVAYLSLGADERAALASRVIPLADLRTRLASRTSGNTPSNEDAPAARSPDAALALLGVSAFRPGQREAIVAVLSGRDALVVMATGSGKSLCYQVPALSADGLTIVVSPLIALIRDQFERLAATGAPVCMLSSNQSSEDSVTALRAIARGEMRVVFCAPERFAHASFLRAVKANRVDLFVVDEAHCLVEWGDDFRPEYARLAEWRDELEARATLALTATATPKVGAEIARRLALRTPLVIATGFDRPNISFDVINLEGRGAVARKWDHLRGVLDADNATPAIVYCGTRKETADLSDDLRSLGFAAAGYHAGMSARERTATQAAFMTGDVQVMCATNAFGMGVDKADVRTVVHWSLPRSLEGYYQEAGRAGRDGQPSRAVLLALKADRGRLIHFINQALEVADVDRFLADLARRANNDGQVEVGLDEMSADKTRLALAAAQRVGAVELPPWQSGMSAVTVHTTRLSDDQRREIVRILGDAKSRAWSQYRGIVRYVDERACRRTAIMRHFGDLTQRATPLGRCCDVCDPLPPIAASARAIRALADDMANTRRQRLAAWRRVQARGGSPEEVCSDEVIAELLRSWPTTADALAAVPGITPEMLAKHGDGLLSCLRRGAKSATASIATSTSSPTATARRPPLNPNDQAMFDALRAWRRRRADGKPAYTVCPDSVLRAIARRRPSTTSELAEISGIGPVFLASHAPDLLATLAQLSSQI